jgi:hydroxymethylpyrimidine/phosphomethylpyrimidine kinase
VTVPVALSVAGSDSGGGAGLQADIKAFFSCGVHGACAVTSVTYQNTAEVRGRFDLPPQAVRAQLEAVLDDLFPAAAKTGMLASASIVSEVASVFRERRVPNLVVDPVMVSTSGHELLDPEAVERLAGELLPLAALVTPNLREAEMLAETAISSAADLEKAAARILELGPGAVLIKGGHFPEEGAEGESVDHLFTAGGERLRLTGPRRAHVRLHGSGCVLSASLAAFLARGFPLAEAARAAKRFVQGAVEGAMELGRGARPVLPPLYSPPREGEGR